MKNTWKTLLALACVIFLLAYISVAFFPHAHSHQNDCALCTILHSSREILGALLLCAFVFLAAADRVTFHKSARLCQLRDTTPVSLKVKLSD